jgi:prenyl protein peptidase
LLAIILIHAFCNWRGLPRLWGRLEGAETVIGPDVGQSKKIEDKMPSAAAGQLGVAWTVTYYVLLVTGAYGFYKFLWTWTESPNALVKF